MKNKKYFSAREEAKGLKYRILYLLSTALIVFSASVLSGCGEESYFENRDSGTESGADISMHDGSGSEDSGTSNSSKTDDTSDAETTVTDYKKAASDEGDTSENSARIFVQIAGAVKSPGVYEMSDGDRVFQVIEKAGGLSDDAYESSVNQAKKVSDGDFIRIYTVAEAESYMKDGTIADLIENDTGEGTLSENAGSDAGGNLINLNTASKEELMTLPGIGASRADDIIAYRSDNGSFKSIEDIKNISGIKEKAFAKIKDLITV